MGIKLNRRHIPQKDGSLMSEEQILHLNQRWNIVSAVALAFSTHLVGAYNSKLALRLGGGDLELALIYSLPAAFGLISLIPGSLLVDLIGKQVATSAFMLMHKVLYILMAGVPMLPESWPRSIIFVFLLGAMNLPGSIYTNGFNSSLGDVFTPAQRSAALANRNRASEITRLIVTAVSGLLMALPQDEAGVMVIYQIYFVVAFAVGLLEVVAYKRFRFTAPNGENHEKITVESFIRSMKESFKFSFTDKTFIRYIFASLAFYIGWQYGWPLFINYSNTYLGALEKHLAIYSIIQALSSVFASSIWLWVSKRLNPFQAIVAATFGMAVTPFVYIVCDSLLTLPIAYFFSGFFVIGTVMNFLMILLEITPEENRTAIMSIHATLVAIFQIIMPLISVWVLDYTNIKQSLAISGTLRFIGCFALFAFYRYMKRNGKSHPPETESGSKESN